jgi:hypothetical protein
MGATENQNPRLADFLRLLSNPFLLHPPLCPDRAPCFWSLNRLDKSSTYEFRHTSAVVTTDWTCFRNKTKNYGGTAKNRKRVGQWKPTSWCQDRDLMPNPSVTRPGFKLNGGRPDNPFPSVLEGTSWRVLDSWLINPSPFAPVWPPTATLLAAKRSCNEDDIWP